MHPAARPTLARAPFPGYVFSRAPRNVYWEMTRACDLACQHCRASAIADPEPGELTTAEAKALIDDIAVLGSMLIMTGGDPLKRDDLFELIAHARGAGVPVAVTPSTTPRLTQAVVSRLRSAGVAALGLSLDGATRASHDAFRGVSGTFDVARDALAWAREVGLPVQVNSTVTRSTVEQLPALYELLSKQACPPVRRWSLFLLVPVGRGASLELPSAERIDALFAWVYSISERAPFHVSLVEAPHYRRYWIQRKLDHGIGLEQLEQQALRMGFGVRDGNGVIFVSCRGDVHPAGFLPEPRLGNVRERSLSSIYRTAPALVALREVEGFHGKCSRCEYRWPCGGSRARAASLTGDALGSDPACAYEPPLRERS